MEKRISIDRAATDATLDAERASADSVSERRLLRARRLRDDLIERDRVTADRQLSKYRESVDSVLARERLAPSLRSRSDERQLADADKKAERDATDALVERSRRQVDDENAEADRAIGELEEARVAAQRLDTNEKLSRERSGADVAVVRAHDDVTRQTDVLSVVAHDLRSPLSVILLNAQHVAAQTRDAETHEILEDIILAASRMERLVSDLVDVVRVESKALTMAKANHDVDALLADVVRTYRPLFAARDISLRRDGPRRPCMGLFDHDRIVQVLSNLLGNAMKFAREGGSVMLGVETREQDIEFFVRDDGPGIEPDAIPHVFDRFWRIGDEGKRGLGLGLYICANVVAAHGGKIWVESAPGQGATFRFTLPWTAA